MSVSNTKEILKTFSLDEHNSIVIGSGILQSLGIRPSNDIDLVVTNDIYASLKDTGKFKVAENHGREILAGDELEIGADWFVLSKSYTFADLAAVSTVIDGVRYISLDFLLQVKQSWVLHDAVVRQKDIDDVQLIQDYI
ncbi:hypothetical protein A2368_00050 [Candidatus Collierbacteria bacterium RIFOXYB1_FULL_49_13]|uniref:Uncharacterized protein n=1 Tax=Candidatus Collierbacteria bacterium RIFOXYB1_FULL_49_13 TaxID=1817728 RepID=A0A1F5FG02_9BACT|nr:MAG: hypothetical protein A2368_00050 [Candidatus Collierbacteria bacterium RIFOXYB1_FULL_49_13]